MPNGYTLEQGIDAMLSIPATIDHDTRAKVGMGAKDLGIAFVDYDAWQSANPRYDAGEVKAMWHSYSEGPVKAGTLFLIAKEHGWTAGGNAPQPAPARATRPAERARKPAPGMSASDVWGRCEAATNAHPYIAAKRAAGVPLETLRVVPMDSQLRIAATNMAGALVVPAYASDGSMQSLQFIPADGSKKLNLPGVSMAGAMFIVGELKPGAVGYICEGIGQAWACWQATGHAAVVAFGAGNMGKVAHALRQQDDAARLVLVPDVGKEPDAAKIAAAVGAAVAAMPDGEVNNFDANDLAKRDGLDVLALLLESATEPPKPEPKVHPLAKFVDLDGTVSPPRWVIPGFIGHGVTVIAGAHGVGKTTALLPLALTAAGLHGQDLLPRQWRHVVYVTEDVEQARRIVLGVTQHSGLGVELGAVRERLHIVSAVRLDPAFVATVGTTYREQFTRVVDGVEVLPLVVLDTKSAVLALDNENDNSEASRMMAALKQGFEGLPVWLVGHVAKPNLNRSDVTGLTSRGASAIEGDANQTLFLVREGESRYLVLGKTRFEPRWPELEITSYTAQTSALDEFGNVETVVMRWGIAAPAQQTRKEAAELAAELAKQAEDIALRQEVRDAVEVAWQTGNPLNRAGVKAKVRRKSADVVAMLENLLNERWLYEVTVPAKERTNNKRAAFLVNLSTEEHEALIAGAGLPADKMVIPESWRKPAIPSVPAPENERGEIDHAE